MFEFEDMSTGFHDVFLNKFAVSFHCSFILCESVFFFCVFVEKTIVPGVGLELDTKKYIYNGLFQCFS